MRPSLQPVAPSIDDPIELLMACHEKVRRFAGLTVKLRDHLARKGPDSQAQEAARSILRYFNIAAPLHHDDEEHDLFPALQQLDQDGLNASMAALEAEHAELAGLWQSLGPWLQAISQGTAHAPPPTVDAFAQRYPAHAQREEDEVYPFASQLAPTQISQISAAMVARRTAG
ncbi:MAG TPA: hemerythrin domain-containing protein [Aquabacterium sp.]|uniref:hemerythrin domain-containing protein n=1 Tax=Aquabacterium sp. TaxID=1872578 RepID=UPI002E365854|nr:hemerythrin domain-containing protein [Aquabacterium sp.]HEX5357241.1 hemerythrin domain-containing protein [Aquabacterium sp.]